MLKEWVSGDHITLVANPNYSGPNMPVSPTVILKWAAKRPQRLRSCRPAPPTASTTSRRTTSTTVKADPTLQQLDRPAFTVLYLGFNVDDAPWNNEKVRQAIAIGIDRKRIVDNFYPAGSSVADYFTPCSVPGGCEGNKWPATDTAKAKQLLQAANFDFTKTYDLYFRPKVRSTWRTRPAWPRTSRPSSRAWGSRSPFTRRTTRSTSPTRTSASTRSSCSAGAATIRDMTDWVDYHFGVGASKRFGTKFTDITDLLSKAASTVDSAARLALYTQANNLIQQHVPMIPLYHAGSALVARADTTGLLPSPLAMEAFWTVKPGDRTQFVFQQNAETSGPLLRRRERRRLAAQLLQHLRPALPVQARQHGSGPRPCREVRAQCGRNGLDVHPPSGRQVRRRGVARRQRRRRDLRRPVGQEEPQPRRQRRHVRLLRLALGRVPEPDQRANSVDLKGAPRSRRPFVFPN